ncbi:MAG: hypothetical protein QW315_00800 [Candidatus Hadarchaeum sp.]
MARSGRGKMIHHGKESRGVESLPVVVMLGAIMAAGTVALGIETISRAQRMAQFQRAVESFDLFVEQCRLLCAGGLSDSRLVEIELGDGKIALKGNLVQLFIEGTVRTELLPLPIFGGENELRSGSYLLRICQQNGVFFIKIEAV